MTTAESPTLRETVDRIHNALGVIAAAVDSPYVDETRRKDIISYATRSAFAALQSFEVEWTHPLYRGDDTLRCDKCGLPLDGTYGGTRKQPRRVTLNDLVEEVRGHVCSETPAW